MKKLYRKGKVHPSPQPPAVSDHLSLLPATILSLTAALSLEDKEVLAYLISCCSSSSATVSSNNFSSRRRQETTNKNGKFDVEDESKEHDPTFQCNCFRCYMCFWSRWDKSPNRQLIHEIIETYEEGLFRETELQVKKSKKGRKKRGCMHDLEQRNDQGISSGKGSEQQLENHVELNCQAGGEEDIKELAELEKGSIRKIVSFIGDSIWGVWNTN